MEVIRVLRLHDHIIRGEIADVAGNVCTRYFLKRSASTLETLVADFEKFTLLGIHEGRFDVVDSKEAIVEVSNVFIEEVSALGVHASRTLKIGVVERVDVPSGTRNIALARLLCHQEFPEINGGSDISWKPAA